MFSTTLKTLGWAVHHLPHSCAKWKRSRDPTRERKELLLVLVLVPLPLHSSALNCSTSVSRVVAPSRLQCYLGMPPTCAVVRRLIPVQRDEWTEEVNEALWIDEKVSVRVHKVSSCPVLSTLGFSETTFGQPHKDP
jgi:hypothetical protein